MVLFVSFLFTLDQTSGSPEQPKRSESSDVPLVKKLSITLDRKMQESAVARLLSLSNTEGGQRLPGNEFFFGDADFGNLV